MVVCVSSVNAQSEHGLKKLANVNFHVAAHHLMRSCKSNCHALNVVYLKCFVTQLPYFKRDTYEMQNIVTEC